MFHHPHLNRSIAKLRLRVNCQSCWPFKTDRSALISYICMVMFTRPLLILRINKLENKRETCQKKKGKTKKQIGEITKTQKQNKSNKKQKNANPKNKKKWGCPFALTNPWFPLFLFDVPLFQIILLPVFLVLKICFLNLRILF